MCTSRIHEVSDIERPRLQPITKARKKQSHGWMTVRPSANMIVVSIRMSLPNNHCGPLFLRFPLALLGKL